MYRSPYDWTGDETRRRKRTRRLLNWMTTACAVGLVAWLAWNVWGAL
jgi:hypothetical protein